MRNQKTANGTIDILFLLTLFCVFAVAVLLVLTAGARSYQSVTEKMNSQYTERTGLAYVEAKLRHYDEIGGIATESFGNSEAIALRELIDGKTYKTLIYFYEDAIRELFFEDGMVFQPEDGETVIQAGGLSAQWKSDTLLEVTCRNTDGRIDRLLYYCHGKEMERDVDE